ncbi:MAG: arsenate reductase ArsC [Myxococcota bacterium]|nr:arsenate reductase ArsC [Myxococcota bacterium]
MTGIVFLCVANSARSQLAEAIARHLDDETEFWSAGSQPTHVRPQVRHVLDEVGIDATGLRSKGLLAVPLDEVELAVTLCAEQACPVLPSGIRHLHWPLPDPAAAPDDEAIEAFRATRDELLRRLPGLLSGEA